MKSLTSITLSSTQNKYNKFKSRLEKSISSGRFDSLPRKKKNRLISRVEKLRARLESMNLSMRGAAVAGSIVAGSAIPNMASAQNLFFKKSGDALPGFTTANDVVVANIDADAEAEIIISTNTGGRILNLDQNDNFFSTSPSSLSTMEDEILVGDLDGDGHLDIIFTEQLDDTRVNKAMNNGDGTFTLTSDLAYATIDDIDLVDWDSDGDLDIVRASGNKYFNVLVNDGDGNFTDFGSNIDLGQYEITDLEFADLDNDGDMDLLHTASLNTVPYSGSVNAIENTTNGPGVPTLDIANPTKVREEDYTRFDDITTFDMDGDGDLDLFFMRLGGSNGYGRLNEHIEGSSFSFSNVDLPYLGSASFTRDAAVADFDNDGDEDLILINNSDQLLLRFDGTSSLDNTGGDLGSDVGDVSEDFDHISFGDIDADGHLDLVGVNTNDNYVYLDVSAPYITGFIGDVIVDENLPPGSLIGELSINDVQGDEITVTLEGDDASLFSFDPVSGQLSINQSLDWEMTGSKLDLDLIFDDGNKSRTETPNIRVNNLKELGQAYLDPTGITLFNTENNISNFLAGDLDSDGDDDLIIGSAYDRSSILLNSEAGLFNSEVDYSQFRDVNFIDFDDDGDLDLFLLRNNGVDAIANKGLEFVKYDIDGAYVAGESFGLVPGDFDNDGSEDVATMSRSEYGDVTFWRFELTENNNQLTEEQFLTLQTSAGGGILASYGNVVDFAIADFDGDDNDDLLVVTEDGDVDSGVDVLYSGDGSVFLTPFSPFTALQADNGYNRIEIEDLNDDGSIDIAAFRSNGTTIDLDIMLNDGAGSFSVNQTLTTNGVDNGSDEQLTDLLFADMNGDGTLDIIATTLDGADGYELNMFFNDGSGSFSLGQTIPDFAGIDIELIDIDKDDDHDVMVLETGFNSNVLKVHLNANVPASNISLSETSFDEHLPNDTEVSTISVTDINPNDVHLLYLTEGDGTNDEHNNFFAINGNSLVVTRDVRAEEFPTLNILVTADDGEHVYQQALVLTVNDVNQAPTAIELSSDTFDESITPGSAVSDITVTDPNTSDPHTLSLVDGEGSDNNDSFTIQGSELILIEPIEFSNTSSVSIRIAADDGRESFEQSFTLIVNEVLGLDDEIKNVLGIYPNPGQNEINFNITNDLLGEMDIQITDLSGRSIRTLVSEKTGKNWTKSLDMTEVEAGVYVIEVTVGKMKVTQRWVKKD